MGQDWLWMREAKISFGFSSKTCEHDAKIVIDGMSIPLIGENSNKTSSVKNNLSSHKVTATKDITDAIKSIIEPEAGVKITVEVLMIMWKEKQKMSLNISKIPS